MRTYVRQGNGVWSAVAPEVPGIGLTGHENWATRDEAIDKMAGALEEFTVEGVHTTIPFHRQVMRNETFRSGIYDTDFIERHYNRD